MPAPWSSLAGIEASLLYQITEVSLTVWPQVYTMQIQQILPTYYGWRGAWRIPLSKWYPLSCWAYCRNINYRLTQDPLAGEGGWCRSQSTQTFSHRVPLPEHHDSHWPELHSDVEWSPLLLKKDCNCNQAVSYTTVVHILLNYLNLISYTTLKMFSFYTVAIALSMHSPKAWLFYRVN